MTELQHRAERFIYRYARAVDVARYQYHFEKGSAEAVLRALSAYQNEDGGMGHALEADCWNPHSSPIQTWAATSIIREINADRNHPVVQGMIGYLESGAAFDGHSWAWGILSNNNYPHAPWWAMQSESKCHQHYNPGASLAGFLLRYADSQSSAYALGRRIAEEAYQYFMEKEVQDCHECRCFMELLEDVRSVQLINNLLDPEKLENKLRQRIDHLITKDPIAWERTYACMPSFFISGENSPFIHEQREWTALECHFYQRTQMEDGGWAVNWKWGQFPEEWALSKNWWRGAMAVDHLLFLKDMNKL